MIFQNKWKKILFANGLLISCISIITPLLVSCANNESSNIKPNNPITPNNPNNPNLPIQPTDNWNFIYGDENGAFDIWKNTNQIKQCVKNGILIFDNSVNFIENTYYMDKTQNFPNPPKPTSENQLIYDSVKEIVFFDGYNSLKDLESWGLYNFSNLEKIILYEKTTKEITQNKFPVSLTFFSDHAISPFCPLFTNLASLNFNTSLTKFFPDQGEDNKYGYPQAIDLSYCNSLDLSNNIKQKILKKFPNAKLPIK